MVVCHGEVFFLARQDGRLDVWDYFYRMNEVRHHMVPPRIQQDPAGSAESAESAESESDTLNR